MVFRTWPDLIELSESVILMDETPVEMETRHVKRLEQIHQDLVDAQGLWERRKAGHHLGADKMLAVVDTNLQTNTELLELANQRLLLLSAKLG